MKGSGEFAFVFQARDIARAKVVHVPAFLNFLNKIFKKKSFFMLFFRIIINAVILKQLVA